MQVVPFIADSPAEALARIRSELGPEAVVVNVRQLPRRSLAQLLKKPQIEVLAMVPGASVRSRGDQRDHAIGADALNGKPLEPQDEGQWRVGGLLEHMGVLPLYSEQVVEHLRSLHGAFPPPSLTEELVVARKVLTELWRCSPPLLPGRPHVFVGAQGVGKTTVLCKWLTQCVLLEGHSARVWRLDGRTANTAELLSVHCDILSVPLERSWSGDNPAESLCFVDMPGVAWGDAAELNELSQRLRRLSAAQVHLVLNAAYETPLLLAQARAFASLRVTDLIVTHLDEEPRWAKLWNLVLGTDYPIRFLSAGQNIPGDFIEASAKGILAHQFPLK